MIAQPPRPLPTSVSYNKLRSARAKTAGLKLALLPNSRKPTRSPNLAMADPSDGLSLVDLQHLQLRLRVLRETIVAEQRKRQVHISALYILRALLMSI